MTPETIFDRMKRLAASLDDAPAPVNALELTGTADIHLASPAPAPAPAPVPVNRKPGRPRKDAVAPPAPSAPVPDVHVAASPEAIAEVLEPPRLPIGVLCLGCIPCNSPYVSFASLVQEAAEAIKQDYRLIDFGKGAPLLIAAIADIVKRDTPSILVVETDSPEATICKPKLLSMAQSAILGLR
jgi:hypothetical protein